MAICGDVHQQKEKQVGCPRIVPKPCEPHHDSTAQVMLASYQGKKDGELAPKPTGLAKALSLVRPIKIAPGHLPSAQAQLEPSVQ